LGISNSKEIENTLLFEIHVQFFEEEPSNREDSNRIDDYTNKQSKEGWIIYRTLKEFENLNEKLSELISDEVKKLFKKLPNLKINSTKSLSDDKLKQAISILDSYLFV
jgi:hypothetical protein